ncbi:MAG TPA: aa3-type cytochrome c oxidase subunit IV [Hyphomonas sp.]|nr:aa3-type cytochrome c oxidase subunit IV [Hyphomonas sp.]MCB9963055.1 aa3-type cytochrome c oxidase subunit IV [Hyphomonas sp.]MCB9972446.1 aa3-type cytochrome c oxidase subunit IV [Hyphomonas sp.]MCC0017707.1 aa3-type cytochrome c oxidase subunit IV [Rhodobiaceae bacterium]HPE47838.1 aa3-type cytochrome c oxidase subunit IV [Hyphomonas sp.]
MTAGEYHHGEMDIHAQEDTWHGFIRFSLWGSLMLFLILGHAILTIPLGLHWAVSLGIMAVVGIGAGLLLKMGGRWFATLVLLLILGLFVQFMIWLFGVLI